MTAKITKLTPPAGQPPRPLAEEGRRFWDAVQREYQVDDAAGVEMLLQVCETLDRIAACEARIAKDGVMILGARGALAPHPLLATVQAARTFVVRTVDKLGLSYEPIRNVGRPSGFGAWRG